MLTLTHKHQKLEHNYKYGHAYPQKWWFWHNYSCTNTVTDTQMWGPPVFTYGNYSSLGEIIIWTCNKLKPVHEGTPSSWLGRLGKIMLPLPSQPLQLWHFVWVYGLQIQTFDKLPCRSWIVDQYASTVLPYQLCFTQWLRLLKNSSCSVAENDFHQTFVSFMHGEFQQFWSLYNSGNFTCFYFGLRSKLQMATKVQ